MKTEVVRIEKEPEVNVILGQAHFIKAVEDIYEAIVTGLPQVKCGIAFVEASGKCLVRKEGNDEQLVQAAGENAFKIGAGHCFIILLKNAFPINVLNALKNVQEVCTIFCATSNEVEVLIAETQQGRGILGVVDGSQPQGIESEEDRKERKEFLRKIQYKL
jgi:hypothetical protein